MNLTEALDFVTLRLAPTAEPVITDAEVMSLLAMAACEDVDGLTPDEDDWVPTYSTVGCYRVLVEGWTVKHGRASVRFDFSTDGQTFRRSQIIDHIEDQRRLWVRKLQTSTATIV